MIAYLKNLKKGSVYKTIGKHRLKMVYQGSKGEFIEQVELRSGTKIRVRRVNAKSLSVELTYRDTSKPVERARLEFESNPSQYEFKELSA